MDSENNNPQMVLIIKEISVMGKKMDKDIIIYLINLLIKVILKIMK